MSSEQPYIEMFWSDWEADEALTLCDLAAEALWLRMLFLMHRSPRKGYLLKANGDPVRRVEDLARLVHRSPNEVGPLLVQLEAEGVFSRDEHGVIFSRRMVKRAHLADIRSRTGKLGADARWNERVTEPVVRRVSEQDLPWQNDGKPDGKTMAPSPSPSPSPKEEIVNAQPEGKPQLSVVPPTADASLPSPGEIQKAWNEAVAEHPEAKIPRVAEITGKRRRHLAARSKRDRDLAWWTNYFALVLSSQFCRGQNDRGWVATFDWAIKCEDNVVKVHEGHYRDRKKQAANAPPERPMGVDYNALAREEAARRARGY